MVHGSWFMVHGSWFMVHGSWFMVLVFGAKYALEVKCGFYFENVSFK
jgi:hypothetical protein